MKFQEEARWTWMALLPFLIVGGVFAPTLLPLLLAGIVVVLTIRMVKNAQQEGMGKWSGSPRARRPVQGSARRAADNRPLKPVVANSAQPHSHAEKSPYDAVTGGYYFRDIQPCTCPRCGFVTDTSHRFCSKCDTDLTKPHAIKSGPLNRKDDKTW